MPEHSPDHRSAPRARGRLVLLAALGALALPLAARPDNDNPILQGGPGRHHHAEGGPGRFLPVRPPHSNPTPGPAGAHLTYYGGQVISNVRVIYVLYGTGSYLPQLTSTTSPSMASFYSQVTNSTYMDWLTEYDTPASGGTNQAIGRGTLGGTYTITPAAANDGATITDAQIQAELSAQITAGSLPAPTVNAAGYVDTIYMIHFPHGKSISQGTSSSCVAGGFCAYHGTYTRAGQNIYYGVMPDMQAGSGCDTGCGSGATTFDNQTSVASHELIEAVTDAEVGLATVVGAPLAWYDSTNGEIGDICNAKQGTFVGSDGLTYTVQQEWSNAQNACVDHGATATNDFSIAVSPTSATVAQGSSAAYTVTTAVTAGAAQTVSLSATGLGGTTGLTGTFSPASITGAGTSTLTVAASASAPAQTTVFTVTGTAPSGSHASTASLTVTSSTPPPASGPANPGFETGTFAGWTTTGTASVVTGGHSGSYAARAGGTAATNGDSTVVQTFTMPTVAAGGSLALSFWYKMSCPDTVTYDWATATLKDNVTGTTTTLLGKVCATSTSWVQVSGAVTATAGHSVTLTLLSHDDNYAGDPTYTLYDDVAVTATAAPPPPPSLANGGFETGSLSSWTASGASASASTAAARTGSYGARLGSTAATNGDSTISQTFSAPAGSTTLSFWYRMSCPDTVTYDWATATLKDNTAGTTSTPLARTCATSTTFTQVSAAVIAGHSYTLTLVSHDDNYGADPTYTDYDDVVVQ